MSLNDKIKVKIPDSKCSYSQPNKNGLIYVYYLTSSKRMPDGKIKHARANIGKLDLQSNMLIPNKRYFEIFDMNEVDIYIPNIIRSYGNYYLFYKIISENGLLNSLINVFGSDAYKIITIAMYMVSEQDAMYYIDDYCDETYCINETYLTGVEATNLFKRITIDKRQEFFNEWVKTRKNNECIAYDVTSISSYAKDISEVDYGYNRDKEALPQINLGMFFGQESGVPLFYNVYNGSLGDKVHFDAMMRYAKSYDMKDISLIMDRGFYKIDNLDYLYENQIPFIMGISNTSTIVSSVIEEEKNNITSSKNELNYDLTNGVFKSITINNTPYRLCLYFNHQKKLDEIAILKEKISKLETELENAKELIDDKRYKKYFDIAINNDNTFKFNKNYEKIDKEIEQLGFYALLSSRLDYDLNKTLKIYRKKDMIEKTFDNLKNFIDSSRIRTHTSETMNGKLFAAFISLIIKTKIDEVIDTKLKKESISAKKLINQMKTIKLTKLYDGKLYIMPLTAKQKKILTAFNITEQEIKESINKLPL